jgi:hypothetical protein
MNEIIEMARQAGFFVNDKLTVTSPFIEDICISPMLKEFAKLVAAKEREFWMEQGKVDVEKAICDEREACAKVCYELPWKDMTQIPSNLAFAAAIRARGEA